jgi:hypothetical protein
VQDEPNDPVSGEAAVTPTSQTGDVTGSSAATPTNGFRALVRRRELVIFFVLSYLIAWSTLPRPILMVQTRSSFGKASTSLRSIKPRCLQSRSDQTEWFKITIMPTLLILMVCRPFEVRMF